MPTKAPDSLLDRDLCRADAREAIDVAVPMLEEVTNYGLAAFARCATTLGSGDMHLAVLLPHHHLLEMLDGVQILIGQAAPSAARPLVRSMFEAVLFIEFITKTPPDSLQYAIRAYAYLVGRTQSALTCLRGLRAYDASTEEGRQRISRAVHATPTMSSPETLASLDTSIATLEARLKKSPWDEVVANLRRRRRKHGVAPWYSVEGGDAPQNLRELADHLGRSLDYDILYRDYSGTTHATDLARQLIREQAGRVSFRGLRDPDEFTQIVSLAASLGMNATRRVLLTYRPDEARAHAQWYVREVRDAYHRFRASDDDAGGA